MSNFIVDFFKEPPIKEEIKDKNTIDKMYKYWQFRIFYTTYIAYILVHLCRKNLSIALPFMASDLHFTNTQLGILGSTLYITYGIGKFVNGIIADRSNIRTFLPTAFVLTAIANLCFVYSTVFITPGKVTFFGLPSASILLWIMAFFWGANGWFQSMVFPPISKSLSYWIPRSQRATKWSIWTTCQKCGIIVSILFSGFLAKYFGWRSVFVIPAIISILFSVWLYDRLRDKPQTMGLPDVDVYNNENLENEVVAAEDKMSYIEIFKKQILFNKIIWLISIGYAFVYVVRFGAEDWFVKYLMEYKLNSIEAATSKLSMLAIFGSLGAIAAGWCADKFFQNDKIKINLILFSGLAISLILFHMNTISILDYVFAASIGFFIAGPQFLLGGICALEASSKKVVSATLGFCDLFGYAGAILSAVGTGIMIDTFGWKGAIYFWLIAISISMFTCLLIMMYQRKHKNIFDCK